MSSRRNWAKYEASLKEQFLELVPSLKAWGQEVDRIIIEALTQADFNLSAVKAAPLARVKTPESFISKALYREKSEKYRDPLRQIDDKVGTRIVFLTTNQLEAAQKILCSYPGWRTKIAKNVSSDIELAPSEFGYKATHIIVKQVATAENQDEDMLDILACEIQLRTLLQHTYAEVSHSTVYKGPYRLETDILRKLARSMAMMEAVDGYFHDMFTFINSSTNGPYALSRELTNHFSQLWPDFKVEDVDNNLLNSILEELYIGSAIDVVKLDKFIIRNKVRLKRIIERDKYHISHQPIVIFVAYLLKNRPHIIERKWPFNNEILDEIAGQMNISRERNQG